MFGKFKSLGSKVLNSAADVLGPTSSSLQEEFASHWKSIMNFYIAEKDETLTVVYTSIPSHLARMLELLVEEETEVNDTGPCMEYLLQQKVLDTLVTLGKGDLPPGMKGQVLRWFGELVVSVKQRLLPHVNAHQPIKLLLKHYYMNKAHSVENELISFLFAMSLKIKSDPSLAGFFVDDPSAAISKSRKSLGGEHKPSPKKSDGKASAPERPQYLLFDMLLEMLWSESVDTAIMACEALLNLTDTPSEYIATFIANNTLFCSVLVQKLQTLFSALPPAISQREVEEFNEYRCELAVKEAKGSVGNYRKGSKSAFGGEAHGVSGSNSSLNSDVAAKVGKYTSELMDTMNMFWGWIGYCDTAAFESNEVIGVALVKMLKEEFYGNILSPLLSHRKEKRAFATTVYITYFLEEVQSPLILDSIITFLLGDLKSIREDREDEVHPPEELAIRYLLISRAKNSTIDICLATLNLFDTIIRKHNEKAMFNLVLRNLQVPEVQIPCKILKNETANINGDAEISAITDKFLDLVPESSRSNQEANGLDCYTYFVDAQQHVLECYWDCQKWSSTQGQMTKRDSVSSVLAQFSSKENKNGSSSKDAVALPEADTLNDSFFDACETPPIDDIPKDYKPEYFFEGSFLSMLYNKLEQILDQPHELNLVVTSIFSRLAEYPQFTLQYYILNPNLDLAPQCNTLFRILSQVAEDLAVRSKLTPNFQYNLLRMRESLDNGDFSESASADDESYVQNMSFFRGVIVLEEFCKEIAAISLVKSASLTENQ